MSNFMDELVATELLLAIDAHALVDVDNSARMIASLCRHHGDTEAGIRDALIQAAVERRVGVVLDKGTGMA